MIWLPGVLSQVASSQESVTLPPIGTALNDCSWAQIRMISDSGLAESYFKVGDSKEITLNGSVNNALHFTEYKICAFIIGINHNSAIEGENRIHFQLAKDPSDGKALALIHSYGVSTSVLRMNRSVTSSSGWETSYMRTRTFGQDPMTEDVSSIMPCFPLELRAVLKPVTKYSNNIGADETLSAVTATTDYMFLLSEFEIFGRISFANTYEQNKQQQYSYYSAGNSKIKYRHDSTDAQAIWWTRSPAVNQTTQYVAVSTTGSASYSRGGSGRGCALAFCV